MRSKLSRIPGVLALVGALGLVWKTETAASFVPPSACGGAGGNDALVLPPHHHTNPVAFVSSRFGGFIVRFARDGAKGDDESIPRGEGGRDDEEFYESLRARMGQLGDDEGSRRSTDDDGRPSPEVGREGLERDVEPKSDDKTSDKSWLRPSQPQPISRRRPSLFSPDDGGGADGEGEDSGRSNTTPRERMMRTESNLVSRATSGTTIALQAAVTLSFLAFQVFVFATGGISDGSDRFPDESVYMLTDKEVQALERVDDGSGPWSGRGGSDIVGRNLGNDADGPIVL